MMYPLNGPITPGHAPEPKQSGTPRSVTGSTQRERNEGQNSFDAILNAQSKTSEKPKDEMHDVVEAMDKADTAGQVNQEEAEATDETEFTEFPENQPNSDSDVTSVEGYEEADLAIVSDGDSQSPVALSDANANGPTASTDSNDVESAPAISNVQQGIGVSQNVKAEIGGPSVTLSPAPQQMMIDGHGIAAEHTVIPSGQLRPAPVSAGDSMLASEIPDDGLINQNVNSDKTGQHPNSHAPIAIPSTGNLANGVGQTPEDAKSSPPTVSSAAHAGVATHHKPINPQHTPVFEGQVPGKAGSAPGLTVAAAQDTRTFSAPPKQNDTSPKLTVPTAPQHPIETQGGLRPTPAQTPRALSGIGLREQPVDPSRAHWVSEIGFTSDIGALDMPATARAHQALLLQQPDLPRHVASQLVHAIQQNGPEKPFDLMLNPAELGRVRISLQTVDGTVSVQVIADRPETLDLMRRHIDLLAQEFQNMGYGASEFTFGQNASDLGRDGEKNQQAAELSDALEADTSNANSVLHVQSDRIDIRI